MDFNTQSLNEDSWMQQYEDIRASSDKAQQKANDKMVAYHAKKNKISDYNVDEKVLVQNPKSKTKQDKRILCESPA